MENYLKESPHHRVPLIIILICIIVVSLTYAVCFFFGPRGDKVVSELDPQAIKRSILAAPNPPANLTSAEVTTRREIISQPNPPAKLTADQIKARKSTMQNI